MISTEKAASMLKNPDVTISSEMVEKALIHIVQACPEVMLKLNPAMAKLYHTENYWDQENKLVAQFILPDDQKTIIELCDYYIEILANRNDINIDQIIKDSMHVYTLKNDIFTRLFDRVEGKT